MNDPNLPARKRSRYAAVLITILLGLASRAFPIFGKYPGDALWTLMVFFALGIILSRAKSAHLALIAFGISCAVELLKLNQNPTLVAIRDTTLGHLVFGRCFSRQNLIAYAVGALVGCLFEVGRFLPPSPRLRQTGPTSRV